MSKQFFDLTQRFVVTFNGPLLPGVLAGGSWSAVHNNRRWAGPNAEAFSGSVIVTRTAHGPETHADVVSYDGVAGDLKAADGRRLPPFSL